MRGLPEPFGPRSRRGSWKYCAATPREYSSTLTAIVVPEDVDVRRRVTHCLRAVSTLPGRRARPPQGQGLSHRPPRVAERVGGARDGWRVELALHETGVPIRLGSGVAACEEVFAASVTPTIRCRPSSIDGHCRHESTAGLAATAVEQSLTELHRWEDRLHAFAWCDPERARARAHAADRNNARSRRPLYGLTVGVKDIFDTAGIPTEYGSPIFAGRLPRRNAMAVRRLEAAGAVVFGKTVTAELAYFAPGPTTNPWNFDRTPGGSSMGSAAAVAAGVVPIAIGTQTNGSVIRPAAFCGVVGFKPSAGRLPGSGALRFSPHLDQVGVFAADRPARRAGVCGARRRAAVGVGNRSVPEPKARPRRGAHARVGRGRDEYAEAL